MVIVWSLVQFSTIFVSSFAFLLITRIILGAGEGPSYSLAMTAASKWLPKEKRGIGISLVSIGGPLGVAISAPILMNMINKLWLAFGFYRHWNHWGYLDSCMAMDCKREKGFKRRIFSDRRRNQTSMQNRPETKFSSVLLSKNFILIALCGFATYWSFTIGLNWLPNYLENVRQVKSQKYCPLLLLFHGF